MTLLPSVNFLFVATVVILVSPIAAAYDQHISSSLYASGYTVRAANGTYLDRRNIVEDLQLSAWNILPGSDDFYYEGPRLSIEVNLRLAGDYGVDSNEMRSARLDYHVPGLNALNVEAVYAFLNIQGAFNGHLDSRLGRQIRLDTIGYTAFDGVESTIYLPLGFSTSAFFGMEVKGAKPFGYDSLELDGVDNVGRDSMDDAYFSSLVEPESLLLLGGELGWSPNVHLDSAVAVRFAGLVKPLQQQTIAARFAVGNDSWRSINRVVANPLLDRTDNAVGALREGTLVTESHAEIGYHLHSNGWLSVSYELYRPVFMLDSIFNIFGQLGRRDAMTTYEHELNSTTRWASWGFMRFVDNNDVTEVHEQDSVIIGGGGGTGIQHSTFSRRLSGRMQVESELSARRFGLEHELGHRFWNDKLWLSVRSSFWHVDDALYRSSKNIVGYVLSANHQFTEKARALFEFENYYGSGTPRFVLTALLQLDMWR
ncbi:MAG: hypothetical protein JXX29_02805 [Deltaproteobacteria bacterium]|nr:hypothetical protein [Deltaproteobacteria bacterium]MBN2670572.1 hypothetical protein [Deltaproteobacteria bacterium]